MKHSSPACITFDVNYSLATMVAAHYGAPLYSAQITHFSDGEVSIDVPDTVSWHNQHAVIIAATSAPVHTTLLEAFLLVGKLKQAGVAHCTWVQPYAAYARQIYGDNEHPTGPMRTIAATTQAVGVDELVLIAPHDTRIAELFTIPVVVASVHDSIAAHIKETIPSWQDCCIVAPDEGASVRANHVAQLLDLPILVCKKERYGIDKVRVLTVDGVCTRKTAIIVDDIVDTGGTALQVARQLRNKGFTHCYGYFVHGVFSRGLAPFESAQLFEKLFVSPTIPLKERHDLVDVFPITTSLDTALDILSFGQE